MRKKRNEESEEIAKAISIYNKAVELQLSNEDDKAESMYIESLNVFQTPQAHNNLGNILKKKGEFEKAKYHYIQALKLDRNYKIALLNLGILYLEIEQYKRAYWTLKVLFKESIDDEWKKVAFLSYGIACIEIGKLEEAYTVFETMINEEDELSAYFGILEVTRRMGKYDKMLEIIKKIRKKGVELQELNILEKIAKKKLESNSR